LSRFSAWFCWTAFASLAGLAHSDTPDDLANNFPNRLGAENFEICTTCHGDRAEGNEDFGAPKLAGQHDWYLITALTNFRDEIRGAHDEDDNGQVMAAMATDLDDEDIQAVVDFITSLSQPVATQEN
jgi:cytochrome c553